MSNFGLIVVVFEALKVICLGFLIIGVYRKDGRLTLPALVYYPLEFIYSSFHLFEFISKVWQEYLFESSDIIAADILDIIALVFIWITVFLYRKQLKEQKSDSSRMVVC